MGHQDLLHLMEAAWEAISADQIRHGFKRAGLGLPLDGTEDHLTWGDQDGHPEKVAEQRARTLQHEEERTEAGTARTAARRATAGVVEDTALRTRRRIEPSGQEVIEAMNAAAARGGKKRKRRKEDEASASSSSSSSSSSLSSSSSSSLSSS